VPDWLDAVPLVSAWLLVAGIGAVVAVAIRLGEGPGPILPPQRRRAALWTGSQVFLALLVFFLLRAFILPGIDPAILTKWILGPDADPEIGKRLAEAVANLIALPAQIALWYGIGRLAGSPGSVFGVAPRRLGADFMTGYFAWLVLTPVVYAVNVGVLVLYVTYEAKQPDDHPLIKLLQSGAGSTPLYVLLFAQAVIVAPIGEEMFFRGIVQPYLTDRPTGGALGFWLAACVGVLFHWPAHVAINDPATMVAAAAPALFVLAVWPLYYWIDVWAPPRLLPVHDPIARRQVARAIVGASILFANVHANVWPTPVPLFVLALGLGWSAYRTQSVVAPIVVHMLFNAIPILAMHRPGVG
jgi:membrane protease YdiL (CAAX protease family)